jgi:hypothetical protein
MRNIFTFFALLLALVLQGQSFTMAPNPSGVIADPLVFDTENYMTISNTESSTKTMRWTRTVVYLSNPSLQTQICDNNACYLPGVNSQLFLLSPNESFSMIVHLLNPMNVMAEAIVHLKVVNTENPADSVTAVYTFSPVSSTENPLSGPQVVVRPNPATDYLQLDHADRVAAVRIYALDGRLVSRREANASQRYNIQHLQAGNYVLVLEDDRERIIKALEIIKR